MKGHKHGGKGRSHGTSRDYQVLAKKIINLLREREELSPLSADGIDVPQELGGTTWTFDVLMSNPKDGTIVVVECKNWRKRMKQEHIAAFAYLVDLLKNAHGKTVRAYYFTKTGYQQGAEKAAHYADIELIISKTNLNIEDTFSIYIREFDKAIDQTKQDVIVKMGTPPKGRVRKRSIK